MVQCLRQINVFFPRSFILPSALSSKLLDLNVDASTLVIFTFLMSLEMNAGKLLHPYWVTPTISLSVTDLSLTLTVTFALVATAQSTWIKPRHVVPYRALQQEVWCTRSRQLQQQGGRLRGIQRASSCLTPASLQGKQTRRISPSRPNR